MQFGLEQQFRFVSSQLSLRGRQQTDCARTGGGTCRRSSRHHGGLKALGNEDELADGLVVGWNRTVTMSILVRGS